MNKKGVSVFELLITVCIFSLLIIMSVPGFEAFFSKIHINNGVRTVTSALNTARYRSIYMNKRVKFNIKGNKLLLMETKNGKWREFLSFKISDKLSVKINSSPVFSPTGSVSPLCSIFVKNSKYQYKITLSISGRIKTTEIRWV